MDDDPLGIFEVKIDEGALVKQDEVGRDEIERPKWDKTRLDKTHKLREGKVHGMSATDSYQDNERA